MQFEARSAGRIDIPKDRCIVLDHARLRGEDYSGRTFMQFATIGCRLEGCRFNTARIENAQFGSGRETSEFIDCSFDGACMEMGSGGYSRFVRCSFRDVDLSHWTCFTVELIECTFSGRLRKAIFNGRVPEEKRPLLRRDHNEFHGNDFSAMELIEVGFRTGIDLTQQRLPSGPTYVYLPDATAALKWAKSRLIAWQDLELRRPALAIVEMLAQEVEKGQMQLLLRADDYYPYSALPREAIEKVFALLRERSD
jgi:hypothetical protein